MSKKKIFLIVSILFIIFFSLFIINAVNDAEKDNIPDSVEKYIPKSLKKFLLENIFYKKRLETSIASLDNRLVIKRNELKSSKELITHLLHEMYELGLDNLEFNKDRDKENITSRNGVTYEITTFKTDYLSGHNWNLGKATAYLDEYDGKLLLVSKDGVFSHVELSEFNKDNVKIKIIKTNIKEIIDYNEWWSERGGRGIKDTLIDGDNLYVSYSNQASENCWNTAILIAKFDFNQLNFKKFFTPPTCLKYQKGYNRWSHNLGGGKIVKYDNENLLLSTGAYKMRLPAQDNETVFGKIILINKLTKDWSIVSKGHRNVQGLLYDNDNKLIISTEHGPKGGDEININLLNEEIPKNFGWPISSYGEHYGNKEKNFAETYEEAPLYKSHKDHGFIEPIKYFVPSIGITDVKKATSKFSKEFQNDYFIGAMGSELEEGDLSLHHIRLNDTNNQIIYQDIIPIKERIRDIHYFEEINKFFLFIENSAAIAILEKKNL